MQEIARKDSAEFFPFFAFAKSVISHLFPRKAKDKEEEEITHTSPEDTSHPVTLDGIIVLSLYFFPISLSFSSLNFILLLIAFISFFSSRRNFLLRNHN
jgi:hypothetical protein